MCFRCYYFYMHCTKPDVFLMVVFRPFNALTLLVVRQEGHLACKKLVIALLVMTV